MALSPIKFLHPKSLVSTSSKKLRAEADAYFFLPDPNVGCQLAVAPFWLGAAAIVLIFFFFGFFSSRLPLCSPLAMSPSFG